MLPNDEVSSALKEYREYKTQFHGELMDLCREYLKKLSIVSVIGILEIVKQETMELEQATRRE
jgi:hypothetical protein